MKSRCLLSCLALSALTHAADSRHDVVIYGGTCAAVTAAVQVKQMGGSVIIVSPDKHLGGLSSGGLGFTDTGNKAVIGGLARDFYHRIWKHYQKQEAWTWQKQSEYGNKGQGTPAMDGENRTMWIFEPHAAEQVFAAADPWPVWLPFLCSTSMQLVVALCCVYFDCVARQRRAGDSAVPGAERLLDPARAAAARDSQPAEVAPAGELHAESPVRQGRVGDAVT